MRTLRTQGEVLDTLTFLMQIFSAFVLCAKAMVVLVAFALLRKLLTNFPLKLRKFVPHLAATAFIINLASANCEEYWLIFALWWNRLGSIIFLLTGSVTMLLILCTIVLVSAIIGKDTNLCRIDFSVEKWGGERGLGDSRSGTLSNSFLSMTPVLLS